MADISTLKVGDMITINPGSTNVNADPKYNGITYNSSVFENVYEVKQVGSPSMGENYIAFGPPGSSEYTGGQWADNVTAVGDPGQETDVKDQEEVPAEDDHGFADMWATREELAEIDQRYRDEEEARRKAEEEEAARLAAEEAEREALRAAGHVVQLPDGTYYYTDPETGEIYYSIDAYLAAMAAKAAYMTALEKQAPSIVQNKRGFPFVAEGPGTNGIYKYNYYIDYFNVGNPQEVDKAFKDMRKASNIDLRGRRLLYKSYTDRYNKYKIQHQDDRLHKSFAHIFFVRPDCYIFDDSEGLVDGSDPNAPLAYFLKNQPSFYYAKRHSQELLRQLTQPEANYDHQFMMYLSNKARSFEIQDEMLGADTYGQGLTGYKLQYGKDVIESRAAGNFSINYVDDRDLHVYNLHKLWIDYISHVFRGRAAPKLKYIKNKNLDYATCVYYILCAEDGETIIFWTKYWGVFPVEGPSSAMSYNAEAAGGIHDPEFQVEYRYSMKEDFNPLTMIEFNSHSPAAGNWRYVHTYQPSVLGTGYTWAGCPFIETFYNDSDLPYTFKLRFRKDPYNA